MGFNLVHWVLSYRARARKQTNGIPFKSIHSNQSMRMPCQQRIQMQLQITNTNTLLVDSNNKRIIPSSHFNVKPLNQIHCSLFGITRALAIHLNIEFRFVFEVLVVVESPNWLRVDGSEFCH